MRQPFLLRTFAKAAVDKDNDDKIFFFFWAAKIIHFVVTYIYNEKDHIDRGGTKFADRIDH